MILNKLTLTDFISHKHTELDFGYGINLILGPNGAGKTSILDAISFALFSDSSGRGKKENLINSKANRCKVALEFTEAGIKYDVEWSMDRGKSARGYLYRYSGEEKKVIALGGEKALIPEIERVLGIDRSMFVQSIYVRQGEIEELITATPADRKTLISKLLGVEDLQRACDNIRAIIAEYDLASKELEGELSQEPGIETDRMRYLSISVESNKLLATKRGEVDEVENKISGLRAALDELKEKKKAFERLDKDKRVLETGIEAAKQKLKKEQVELDRAVWAEARVSHLAGEVESPEGCGGVAVLSNSALVLIWAIAPPGSEPLFGLLI